MTVQTPPGSWWLFAEWLPILAPGRWQDSEVFERSNKRLNRAAPTRPLKGATGSENGVAYWIPPAVPGSAFSRLSKMTLLTRTKIRTGACAATPPECDPASITFLICGLAGVIWNRMVVAPA